MELLVKNEIARRVTQMYVLERLSRLDIATARDMLASLVPALERLSKVCHVAFLGSLEKVIKLTMPSVNPSAVRVRFARRA